jgi:hypothetical protein
MTMVQQLLGAALGEASLSLPITSCRQLLDLAARLGADFPYLRGPCPSLMSG